MGTEPLDGVLAAARDILDSGDIEAGDNFFDRGGDSLAAVRFVARVRRETGGDLALGAVFSAPDFRVLAGLVQAPSGGTPR